MLLFLCQRNHLAAFLPPSLLVSFLSDVSSLAPIFSCHVMGNREKPSIRWSHPNTRHIASQPISSTRLLWRSLGRAGHALGRKRWGVRCVNELCSRYGLATAPLLRHLKYSSSFFLLLLWHPRRRRVQAVLRRTSDVSPPTAPSTSSARTPQHGAVPLRTRRGSDARAPRMNYGVVPRRSWPPSSRATSTHGVGARFQPRRASQAKACMRRWRKSRSVVTCAAAELWKKWPKRRRRSEDRFGACWTTIVPGVLLLVPRCCPRSFRTALHKTTARSRHHVNDIAFQFSTVSDGAKV